MTEKVLVKWYECDCQWLTKYCDEEHVRTAWVPLDVVKRHETAKENDGST